MHVRRSIAAAVLAITGAAVASMAAATYPRTLTLDARIKSGTTTVTSAVTVRVERLIDQTRRTRALDGLRFNGYGGFLNTIKGLQPLGTIKVESRSVDIKYAWESEVNGGHRLVLVADRPLVFLGNAETKSKAGYELTIIDLKFDASGKGTGVMAGAARVKPSGDGDVILDDFADAPIDITVRSTP